MPNAQQLVLGLLCLGVVGCVAGGESQRTAGESPPSTAYEPSEETRLLFEALEATKDTDSTEYESLKTGFTTAVQMTLGQLGFGAGPFTGVNDAVTQAAVRRYEESRGLPITGDPLSPLTFEMVAKDGERIANLAATPQPSLPLFGDSGWDNGYFTAKGPWFAEGQRLASHDAITLTCVRADGECRLDYAQMSRSSHSLDTWEEAYSIASWDAAEIFSAPLDFPCARYVLRINRIAESVRLTRSTLSQEGLCTHMGAEEIIMYLPTWGQAFWERQREQNDIFETLYQFSPEARDVIVQREDGSR